MDNTLMLSVIIPIYNGEAFVRRAAESVICQMDGQIELILVDDGSTDNSGKLCDALAAEHPLVRVVHKENGGTSSAKNRGIALAKGQYLCFLDCDDYMDSDTYATIIPLLKAHQPDVLDFDLRYIDKNGEAQHSAFHMLPKNRVLCYEEWSPLVLPPLLNLKKDDAYFILDFAVNKMYKTAIIRQHNVYFDEDKRTWEDRTFILRHLKYCQTFYSMDAPFYNYVYTPNSLSQRYTPDYFRIILANFHHYRELFEDQFDFDTQYANTYWAHSIQNMLLLSLEQTDNTAIIRRNIEETLRNELVVHWFTERESKNAFEKALSRCILHGEIDRAVCLCEKQQQVNKRHEARTRFFARIKGFLKRIIGR